MRVLFLFTYLICNFTSINAQEIYSKAYGNAENPVIIFLHGGPDFNAVSFEKTTAQPLSEEGFYVIVYDRRGEGRSEDTPAKFTFEESFDDLKSLYQKYNLNKVTLLGHGFGGLLGTLFTEKYPEKVSNLVLLSVIISPQITYKYILAQVRTKYKAKNDTISLKYLQEIEKMDTSSFIYSDACLSQTLLNDFYFPKKPNDEAKLMYISLNIDDEYDKYGFLPPSRPSREFWESEKYTTLDITPHLQKILSQKVNIYGLYGKDDNLYPKTQIIELKKLIGAQQIKYLKNCSYNVFMDQQSIFTKTLKSWIK